MQHYKAAVVGAQVAKMNPDIKTRSLQLMVAPATEGCFLYTPCRMSNAAILDTFDRGFWTQQDMICNALDNIQARLYVDNRCVQFKKVLVEAGTEAVKCNCCVESTRALIIFFPSF